MFSSERTPTQRTPSDKSIVVFGEQRLVLYLIFCSHKHVVLVLCSDGLVKIQSFTDSQSLKNSLCVPVAGCPVECLASLNNLIESTTYLFDRSKLIVNMSVDDIDVVKLQSLQ
jgi:hypothetical protein